MSGPDDLAPLVVGVHTVLGAVLLAAASWGVRPLRARRPAPIGAEEAGRTRENLRERARAWQVPVVSAAVLLAATRGGPVVGAGLAVGAWMVPRQVRAAAHERTGRAVDRALPGLLDAWARHVRGGLAPAAALRDAVVGSGPALRRAMGPLVASLTRGASLEEAVAVHWPERPGPAGPLVAAAVAVAQPLGGLRAQGIDAIAATVREHAGLEAEKHVQAAQARVSAVVMTVAPLAFCAFLVLRDGAASAFLLRSPVGTTCGALGVGLDLLAGVWMRAAVRRAR